MLFFAWLRIISHKAVNEPAASALRSVMTALVGQRVFRDIGIIDDANITLCTGFHDVGVLLFAQQLDVGCLVGFTSRVRRITSCWVFATRQFVG